MAYVQTRFATTGALVTETFNVLASARREVGLYLLVFGGLGVLASLSAIGGTVSVLSFFFYFAAQYWLCRQMLLRAGLGHVDSFKIFSLFFMAILLSLGIVIGFNFFWIPGILLGAKWVMSPAFLVARDDNLFEAIGASWRASDGNTLSLSLAYAIVCAIGFVALVAVISLGSMTQNIVDGAGRIVSGPIEGLFFSLTLNAVPILMMALSVGAYRLLSDQGDDLTEIFE